MRFSFLAQEGNIGSMVLKNRIVVPSLNNNYTSGACMTQRSIDSYIAKARGGAGLIITEATSVDYPRSRSVLNPAIDDDKYMPGLRAIAHGCHRYGARVVVQLSHVGRQTRRSSSGMDPVAPSPIAGNSPLYPDPPRVLSSEDILELVDLYGTAALRAKRCGYDGVEIIMGHGYLINNFLSPLSNQREDEYGGIAGGLLFCSQIMSRIRETCGSDFPIICRINGDDFVQRKGNTLVEAVMIAQALESFGADAIHVSGGMRDSELNFNDQTSGTPHGSWLPMAAQIKRSVSIPIIAVKRITPELGEQALRDNIADFIAFGKQSIADPDFANKILDDRLDDMVPCTSCCQGCYDRLWMWLPVTCMLNPEAGMTEQEITAHRALRGNSRILVVGAGPAGCESAIELARMGHQVTLIERSDHIGGSYASCVETARKHEVCNVLQYFSRCLAELRVCVKLDTAFDESMLECCDILVDASGAEFCKPEASTPDCPRILDPKQALTQKDALGRFVVILACGYGCAWTCGVVHHPIVNDITSNQTTESYACTAGFAAADLAEELADRGMKVEIITPRDAFARGMGFSNRNSMMKRFFSKNISVSTNVQLEKVVSGGLMCQKAGYSFFLPADTIVASQVLKSSDVLERAARQYECAYYTVGDRSKIGNAMQAIHDGFALAETITTEHPASSQPPRPVK